MRYVPVNEFMQRLFAGEVSRRAIVEQLFTDSDIAAIANEHGVDRATLVETVAQSEASDTGARLRTALTHMRTMAADVPTGAAFPADLERATDGGLELVGLFANPMMTTAMILHTEIPPLDRAVTAIDPRLSLATYASRVFRVLAVQHPSLATPLSNAAAALERA